MIAAAQTSAQRSHRRDRRCDGLGKEMGWDRDRDWDWSWARTRVGGGIMGTEFSRVGWVTGYHCPMSVKPAAPSETALDAQLIEQAVAQAMDVRVVASVDSTNRVLMQAGFAAGPARTQLLVAQSQTAGRGRRGRSWLHAQHGIAMSLALERLLESSSRDLVGWSIAAGVAVVRALRRWAPELRLKWPNDLLRQGRKCGGILIETRREPPARPGEGGLERAVIGVGINLQLDESFQAGLGQPVTGLFDAAPGPGPRLSLPAREIVIGSVARELVQAWAAFLREGLLPFRDDWTRFDALCDCEVVVLENGRVLMQGLAQGIDETGALQLRTEHGMQPVVAGDVSVRSVNAAGGAR
jgi:BirA family transcriptional regulator, biotin operon repressor / biotin---[acetyl-CoA-carboxylase] ligase